MGQKLEHHRLYVYDGRRSGAGWDKCKAWKSDLGGGQQQYYYYWKAPRAPQGVKGAPGTPQSGYKYTPRYPKWQPQDSPKETVKVHPSTPQGPPKGCQGIADEPRKPGCMLFTMVSKGPLRAPTCNIAKHGLKWRHRPGIDGICNGLAGSTGDPRDAQGATRRPKRAQEEPR